MLPLISIIIPVYNQNQELLAALQSIRQQTYKNLEIIVVDDGSEIPVEVVAGIKLQRQKNQGAPAARNKGFALSKGDYVIFWDADIVGKPEMLEKMYLALQNNSQAAYAYAKHRFGKKLIPAREFDPVVLKHINYITTTSLIRREDFFRFDESLKRFQDWDLWLTMLEQGKTGVYVSEILFTIKAGGTMSQWLPKIAYKKPWKYLPGVRSRVEKYEEARAIISKKHGLSF